MSIFYLDTTTRTATQGESADVDKVLGFGLEEDKLVVTYLIDSLAV